MKNPKLISFLLFAGIASGAVSCGEAAAPAADTTASDTTAVPAETTSYLDSLPVENLAGYTFRVIGQSTNERQNFYTEEKDGDVINDAIHTRDQQVEDRLGITLEYTALADRNQVATQVINTVLADDPAYEMAITAMSQGVNTMIGLARTELEYRKYVDSSLIQRKSK